MMMRFPPERLRFRICEMSLSGITSVFLLLLTVNLSASSCHDDGRAADFTARNIARGTRRSAMIILYISCIGTFDIPIPIITIEVNRINMYLPRCNVERWNAGELLFILLDKLTSSINIVKIIEVLTHQGQSVFKS